MAQSREQLIAAAEAEFKKFEKHTTQLCDELKQTLAARETNKKVLERRNLASSALQSRLTPAWREIEDLEKENKDYSRELDAFENNLPQWIKEAEAKEFKLKDGNGIKWIPNLKHSSLFFVEQKTATAAIEKLAENAEEAEARAKAVKARRKLIEIQRKLVEARAVEANTKEVKEKAKEKAAELKEIKTAEAKDIETAEARAREAEAKALAAETEARALAAEAIEIEAEAKPIIAESKAEALSDKLQHYERNVEDERQKLDDWETNNLDFLVLKDLVVTVGRNRNKMSLAGLESFYSEKIRGMREKSKEKLEEKLEAPPVVFTPPSPTPLFRRGGVSAFFAVGGIICCTLLAAGVIATAPFSLPALAVTCVLVGLASLELTANAIKKIRAAFVLTSIIDLLTRFHKNKPGLQKKLFENERELARDNVPTATRKACVQSGLILRKLDQANLINNAFPEQKIGRMPDAEYEVENAGDYQGNKDAAHIVVLNKKLGRYTPGVYWFNQRETEIKESVSDKAAELKKECAANLGMTFSS